MSALFSLMLRYQFEATNQSGYLHVSVSGPHDSVDISYDYMLRMMKSARENQQHIILIEEDFPDHPGILEGYGNFTDLRSHLVDFSIVSFDHQTDHYHRNKFLEAAVEDLGLHYYVCKTKEDAVERVTSLIAEEQKL